MPVSTKVEAIDRDVSLIISDLLSPAAQSAMLADGARDQLQQGEQINQTVLGRVPPHTTSVDGLSGASEDQVRPTGTIIYEFALIVDVLQWIADQLKSHSPVGAGPDKHPGLYRDSHTLFADQKEVPIGDEIPPDATEYVFTNTVPYARKIEQGESPQFPDGVFEGVAALARRQFGNQASIEFTYRGLIGLSSGSGMLVNPANDPTRSSARGRSSKTGTKAYNVASVRFPCIVVKLR